MLKNINITMILNSTILSRLQNVICDNEILQYDYDIRYLDKWIKKYPSVFPKFMLKDNFQPIFNWELNRWEIYKTKK